MTLDIRLRLIALKSRLKHWGRPPHKPEDHGNWADGMGGTRDGVFPTRGGGGGDVGGIQGLAQQLSAASRGKKPKIGPGQLSLFDSDVLPKVEPVTEDKNDNRYIEAIRAITQAAHKETDEFVGRIATTLKGLVFEGVAPGGKVSESGQYEFLAKFAKRKLNSKELIDALQSEDFDASKYFSSQSDIDKANAYHQIVQYRKSMKEQSNKIYESILAQNDLMKEKIEQAKSLQEILVEEKQKAKQEIVDMARTAVQDIDYEDSFGDEILEGYQHIAQLAGSINVYTEKLEKLTILQEETNAEFAKLDPANLDLARHRELQDADQMIMQERNYSLKRMMQLSENLDKAIALQSEKNPKIKEIMSESQKIQDKIDMLNVESSEENFYENILGAMTRSGPPKNVRITYNPTSKSPPLPQATIDKIEKFVNLVLAITPASFSSNSQTTNVHVSLARAKDKRSGVIGQPWSDDTAYMEYKTIEEESVGTIVHEAVHILQNLHGRHFFGNLYKWTEKKIDGKKIVRLNKIKRGVGYKNYEYAFNGDVKRPYVLKFYGYNPNSGQPFQFSPELFREIQPMAMNFLYTQNDSGDGAEVGPLMIESLLTLPSSMENAHMLTVIKRDFE